METKKERLDKVLQAIERINTKKNKLMFYLPSVPQASGGIAVVYEHVKRLTDLGYDAMVIHEETPQNKYEKPTWLGEEYTSLKHFNLSLKENELKVNAEDVLVIPEGFPNIMKQSENLPCIKVVFCQSYAYVLSGLMPGVNWATMGIREVMVVTPTLQSYLEKVFGEGTFNIQVVRPSISDVIFKPSTMPKKPIVAISARDAQELMMVAKHFYAAYPQYKFVSFKHMQGLSRTDFAETLNQSCLAVWIDRVAGFGTFPIECAKSDVPFIGLIPDILPEYAKDNQGIWTNSILDIPDLIASYLKLWLEDSEPQEIVDDIRKLAKEYTSEEEAKNIETIYAGYLNEKKEYLTKVAEAIQNETEDGE